MASRRVSGFPREEREKKRLDSLLGINDRQLEQLVGGTGLFRSGINVADT